MELNMLNGTIAPSSPVLQRGWVVTVLLVAIASLPKPVTAQQVLADGPGTIVTTGGSIDMGTISGDDGIALRARNGGVIESVSPVTITTRGGSAIGAQALSGGQIFLIDGSSIHTFGNQADGIVASGLGSMVVAEGTDVLTESVGYGLIAGTGGEIQFTNGTLRVLVGSGVATFTGGLVTLTDSVVETNTRLALWVNPGSTIVGNGAMVTSAQQGAYVEQGTLVLNGSSLSSSSIGIQTASGATIRLTDTDVVTSGTSAYGIYLLGGSNVVMEGGSIRTVGTGARALWSAGGANTATLTNALVEAENSSAILAWGAGSTFDLDLSGSTMIGNSRVIEVGSGGSLDLDASRSSLTGSATTATGSTSDVSLTNGSIWTITGSSNLTALSNTESLIQFSAPSSDPLLLPSYKTLSVGAYGGIDGRIGFNAYLEDDTSPSDRLIINGGTASGSTGLSVNNTGGGGALTTGNGILLVDAINGGDTGGQAFTLAGPVVAGPYEYSLFRGAADGTAAENWYLRSELAPVPPGPDPTPPGPDPLPDYRPEVSLYAAIPTMAAIYGRHMIDTLHERVGDEEQRQRSEDAQSQSTEPRTWMRAIGHWGHRSGDPRGIYDGAPEFDYRFAAFQAGLDLYSNEANGLTDRAGLYLAYGHGIMDVTQDRIFEERSAGRSQFDAVTLGGYWTRLADDGWYLDGVLQGIWYGFNTRSNRSTAIGFPEQDADGVGLAASLEAGRAFHLADGWQIEPQAQLVLQTIRMGDFNDGAADIDFDTSNSVTGRIGARLARSWDADGTDKTSQRSYTVWGRASLWHEFAAEAQTDISSANGPVAFASDLKETWLEIGIGGTTRLSQSTSLYGNVNFSTTFDADQYAWNGKLGLKMTW